MILAPLHCIGWFAPFLGVLPLLLTQSIKEAGMPAVRSCLTHTILRCMENMSKTMTKPIYLSYLNEWRKQWIPPLVFKSIKGRKKPTNTQNPSSPTTDESCVEAAHSQEQTGPWVGAEHRNSPGCDEPRLL